MISPLNTKGKNIDKNELSTVILALKVKTSLAEAVERRTGSVLPANPQHRDTSCKWGGRKLQGSTSPFAQGTHTGTEFAVRPNMKTERTKMIILSAVVAVVALVLFFPIGKHLPEQETLGAKTLAGAFTRAVLSGYAEEVNPAKLVKVQMDLRSLKDIIADHYNYNSSFPASLEDAGIYGNGESANISKVDLRDGMIEAHLKPEYGENKFIRLEPEFDSGGEIVHWSMSSNLDKRNLAGTKIASVDD